MKLHELRDRIEEAARPGVTYRFVDLDEREFSTGDSGRVTGEVVPSYGFLDRVTGIALSFEPCEEGGVALTRDGLLEWLGGVAAEYGWDAKVRVRLYDSGGSSEWRDMLTGGMWSRVEVTDNVFELADGCGKRPYSPPEWEGLEKWAADHWAGCQ